ncbi:flagellar hook-length control protein FliK, partial [Albidovulum sp.]
PDGAATAGGALASAAPADAGAGAAAEAGDTSPAAAAAHRPDLPLHPAHPAPTLAVAVTQAGALPHGMAVALVAQSRKSPAGTVEITLRPEELGKVRITLSPHDSALAMTVQAERPETLDLMRRHIESLAQEFRALGFTDLSFSFSSGDAGPQGQAAGAMADNRKAAEEDPATATAAAAPAAAPVAAPAAAGDGRLDLRL